MSSRPTQFAQSYFHGAKAALNAGDFIAPGYASNYGQRHAATHVYFTSTLDAAIWGAELASGESQGRIYVVEPTGAFENDPDLTDQKFPGNPTQSYRTSEMLRVIGEVIGWTGHDSAQLQAMRDNIARIEKSGGA